MKCRCYCRLAVLVLSCGALGLMVATTTRAEGLDESFLSLPEDNRIAVQQELARAELFLAPVDGRWSGATERALLRSVETIALKSNDRLHPDLSSPAQTAQFLTELGDGTYARLLYGGSFFQRIFFLVEDPVQEIKDAEAAAR